MSNQSDKKIDYIQSKLDDVAEVCNKIDKEVALQKAAFDDHLSQDERMYQEFKRMNNVLQDNTESLKEHMHRTELLEGAIIRMDERLNPIEIQHIEKEAVNAYINKKLKLIAKIAAAATAVAGFWLFLKPIIVAMLS